MAMNTPTRFESLLWMASPMAAWAQASNEAPAAKAATLKPTRVQAAPAAKARRKRGKSVA
jgi:hypothetical protein